MRKKLRHLVVTGCVASVFLMVPQVAFSNDEEAAESASGIQVTLENGRLVVTNAAPNAPISLTVERRSRMEPALDEDMPLAIQHLVHSISMTHGLDPRLVAAVMKVESNYNRWARSSKGALGLMQLIPATGARFGVRDFFDPAQNIEGGVRYLKFLSDKFGASNLDLMLAAYNAGENLVERVGGVPSIRETRDYVRRIRTIYRPSETPVLTSALPEVKVDVVPVEPQESPAVTIYQNVDSRGVVHFSNLGPPN